MAATMGQRLASFINHPAGPKTCARARRAAARRGVAASAPRCVTPHVARARAAWRVARARPRATPPARIHRRGAAPRRARPAPRRAYICAVANPARPALTRAPRPALTRAPRRAPRAKDFLLGPYDEVGHHRGQRERLFEAA
jgi:hypothetical protein